MRDHNRSSFHFFVAMQKLFVILLLLMTTSCGGKLTVIPNTGGLPVEASYSDGFGKTSIRIKLPSDEVLKGDLIWIPPGGQISSAFITGQNPLSGVAVSSGNKGMLVGTIYGDRGTVMKIWLLCNAFTGHCVGTGQTNDGVVYNIQK